MGRVEDELRRLSEIERQLAPAREFLRQKELARQFTEAEEQLRRRTSSATDLWLRGVEDAARVQRQIREVSNMADIRRLIAQQDAIRQAMPPFFAAVAIQRDIQIRAEAVSQAARSFQQAAIDALSAFESRRRFHSDLFRHLPDPSLFAERSRTIEAGFSALNDAGYGFTAHRWDLPLVVEMGKLRIEVRDAVATNRFSAFVRDPEFSVGLQQVIEATPVFRRRWPIIAAGLEAHRHRNYLLAIPTLLAQVEGCITDILVLRGEAVLHRGKLYARGKDGKAKKGHDGKPVRLRGLGSKLAHSRWNGDEVLEAVSVLIANQLVGDRNEILHGRDVNYGKAKLSTQCILLLWVLALEVRDKLC